MPPFRRLVVILFWLVVAGAYGAAVVPQQDAPHLSASDKLDHMAAFFTIALLARLAYPRLSGVRLFLALALFGGLIELSQALPLIHRDAEWADWIADIAAAAVGLLLAWPLAIAARKRLPPTSRR